MRRILAAALALSLATGALAQEPRRAMLVRYPHNGTAGGTLVEQVGLRYVIGAFENQGIVVDQYRMEQVKTEWLRRAHMPIGADFGNTIRQGVRQYDLVYIYGYRAGVPVSNVYGGVTNADSLTLVTRGWPDKPTVFQTCIGVQGVSNMTSSSSCSTGVTVNLSGAFPAGMPSNLMCAFVPGTDIEFDTFSATQGWQLDYANNDAVHGAGAGRTGYLRPLIGYASTGNIDLASSTDYDGPIPATNIARPDTALAWERGRGPGEKAPIVFTQLSASGGAPIARLPQIAIARADSANAVPLTGTAPGWSQERFSVGIHGLGYHSDNNIVGGLGVAAGVPCWGGGTPKCDTANFKRLLIDSLGTLLAKRGAKIALGYQVKAETVAVYPNEVGWVKAMPAGTWKVYPWEPAGLYTTAGSKSGNGDDTFGRMRSNRTWWSAASGVPPYDCAATDTSIYCELKRENQAAVNAFGAVLGFRYAPDTDFFPEGYSRRMLPHPDTVGTALYAAGIRTVGVNIETHACSPGLTTAPNGSGTLQPEITNKIWYGPVSGMLLRGWLAGMAERGYVKTLAERGTEVEIVVSPNSASHPFSGEFEEGRAAAAWFHNDPWPYYHNFRSKLDFFSVPAAHLTSNALPNQNLGYWEIKWLINKAAAVNFYSPKKVVAIVWPDEL
jgi:hypothetical protein